MAKPRDYRAENARSHIGQAVAIGKQMFGSDDAPTHYSLGLHQAIQRALGEEHTRALMNKSHLSAAQVRHLAEIARLEPKLARELAQKPQDITPTYRKYCSRIAELKTKRISAECRIERAWPGYWQRWLQKFAPEDWPEVRRLCARLIHAEIEAEED